jgi:hypothetical protein
MNIIKSGMIKEARKKHKKIYPVAKNRTLNDCFSDEDDSTIFWYNTKDGSTHVIVKPK